MSTQPGESNTERDTTMDTLRERGDVGRGLSHLLDEQILSHALRAVVHAGTVEGALWALDGPPHSLSVLDMRARDLLREYLLRDQLETGQR